MGASRSTPRSALELTVLGGATVDLLFVEDRDRSYVLPSAPAAPWFVAAVREGSCRVRWPDGRRSTSATTMVRDPAFLRRLDDLFRAKYGPEVWSRYFAGRTEALELDPQRPVHLRSASDRARFEFDAVSAGYDDSVRRHSIDRYLKDRVTEVSLTALRGADPILEIGPGTGYHTRALLAAGHRVVAVDISAGMLAELHRNTAGDGAGDRLATRTASLGELGPALSDLPDAYFGAAFSAFGPFNIDPDLTGVGRALGRLVRPGGRLIFTSLNRPGLAPVLWELSLARPAAAGYRLRSDVPPGGIRYPLELHLRTPTEWDAVFAELFVREWAQPVSVAAPPFDSERLVRFLGVRGAARARRWDSFLSSRAFGVAAAEWLLLCYRRRDPAEPE